MRLWEIRVIDGVSIVVRSGTIVNSLGPSGRVKATILRSTAGLDEPDVGRIAIDSDPEYESVARTYVPAEKREIGMVLPSYAIWPHFSVFENVAFPLRLRRVSR